MKNLRHASVGEQYHLDKTLEQNIRLQNEITSDIKVSAVHYCRDQCDYYITVDINETIILL